MIDTCKIILLGMFKLLILVSCMLLICDAGELRTLNGNIKMEYVTDPLGREKYMVFYDRILTEQDYENATLKNPKSEAECRLNAIVRNMKFCSVHKKTEQSNITCRVSNKNIQDGHILIEQSGAVTYVRETEEDWWPHDDGIFYEFVGKDDEDKMTASQAQEYCSRSNTRSLPITRNSALMSLNIQCIAESNGRKIILGMIRDTNAGGNHQFIWQDTNNTVDDYAIVDSSKYGIHINGNGDTEEMNDSQKSCIVCLYNIFNLSNW